MKSRISPARIALVIAMAAFGFWLGNIGVQYGLAALPVLKFGADASAVAPEAIAGMISRHPLGISPERWPMIGGAVFAVAMFASANVRRQNPAAAAGIPQEKVHGDERFASIASRALFAHTRDKKDWPCPPWAATVADDNFLLSAHSKIGATANPDPEVEQMCPNRHVFIMAGSGSGKTYKLVTPNALQLLGNYVFTDPKGELFRRFARFFERHGYDVAILDFRDEAHMMSSCRYNPLVYCNDITSINHVVELFIENTTGEKSTGDQTYFINMERAAYTAITGLFVFMFKENGNGADCTLPNLIDYLLMLKAEKTDGVAALDIVFGDVDDSRTLPGFTSFKSFILSKYRDRGPSVLYDESVPEVAVLNSYSLFKTAAGDSETMANVISSCASRLQILNNPAVRRLLSADDLDLRTMGSRKRALFIAKLDRKGPYDFIAAMVLDQLFHIAAAQADGSPSGHLDIPLWCILDEVANIGKIPNLNSHFATMRSRWVNLVAIVQNGEQLKAVYGDKESKSIRSNSGVFCYMGGGLLEDCEQISKEMGTTTRITTTYSQTTSATGGSVTKQTQTHEVPLMRPAELFNYHPDTGEGFRPDAILTHYGHGDWFIDGKLDPTKHPRWRELQRIGPTDFFEWTAAHNEEIAAREKAEVEREPGREVIKLDDEDVVALDLTGQG